MIRSVVYKENNLLYFISFFISNQIAEVFSKFNIPSSFETIPNYFLFWPDEANKKITPSGVA